MEIFLTVFFIGVAIWAIVWITDWSDWEHLCTPPKARKKHVGRVWVCSCRKRWEYKENSGEPVTYYFAEVKRFDNSN